jgi:hypothetical protein
MVIKAGLDISFSNTQDWKGMHEKARKINSMQSYSITDSNRNVPTKYVEAKFKKKISIASY